MAQETNQERPPALAPASCSAMGELEEISKLVGNHNALYGVQRMACELANWKHCSDRLRVFAIAYRTHPLRNPNDKLDEVLALYESLASPNS